MSLKQIFHVAVYLNSLTAEGGCSRPNEDFLTWSTLSDHISSHTRSYEEILVCMESGIHELSIY